MEAKLISDTGREIPVGEKEIDLSGGSEKLHFETVVKSPKKWSAEAPNLYTLVMSVYTDGNVAGVKTYNVGFKNV